LKKRSDLQEEAADHYATLFDHLPDLEENSNIVALKRRTQIGASSHDFSLSLGASGGSLSNTLSLSSASLGQVSPTTTSTLSPLSGAFGSTNTGQPFAASTSATSLSEAAAQSTSTALSPANLSNSKDSEGNELNSSISKKQLSAFKRLGLVGAHEGPENALGEAWENQAVEAKGAALLKFRGTSGAVPNDSSEGISADSNEMQNSNSSTTQASTTIAAPNSNNISINLGKHSPKPSALSRILERGKSQQVFNSAISGSDGTIPGLSTSQAQLLNTSPSGKKRDSVNVSSLDPLHSKVAQSQPSTSSLLSASSEKGSPKDSGEVSNFKERVRKDRETKRAEEKEKRMKNPRRLQRLNLSQQQEHGQGGQAYEAMKENPNAKHVAVKLVK
jgi:hypothetical protein